MCSSFAAKQRLYRLAQNVILFRLLDQEFLQEYLLLGQEAPLTNPGRPSTIARASFCTNGLQRPTTRAKSTFANSPYGVRSAGFDALVPIHCKEDRLMNRKFLASVSLSLSGVLMVTHAADAALIWGEFVSYFQESYSELQTVLRQTVADEFTPETAAMVQGTIDSALGTLGYPDPQQLRQGILRRLEATPPGDLTTPVPVTQTGPLTRDLNRQLLHSQAAAVLGRDGQIATQEKADQIAESVAVSQQEAAAAQAAISTQQAIKHMTEQHALNTELLGALQNELMQTRSEAMGSALTLADISETLDEQTRYAYNQRRVEALTSLSLAATARLF